MGHRAVAFLRVVNHSQIVTHLMSHVLCQISGTDSRILNDASALVRGAHFGHKRFPEGIIFKIHATYELNIIVVLSRKKFSFPPLQESLERGRRFIGNVDFVLLRPDFKSHQKDLKINFQKYLIDVMCHCDEVMFHFF